jgi:hypothetical protein
MKQNNAIMNFFDETIAFQGDRIHLLRRETVRYSSPPQSAGVDGDSTPSSKFGCFKLGR